MPDDDLIRTIRDLEERLLARDVKASRRALVDLLTDDFVEIGASGTVYNKDSIIGTLLTETHYEVALSDFNVREMSSDQAQATYVATIADTGTASRCSSVWRYQKGVWRMAFHRGTPIPRDD